MEALLTASGRRIIVVDESKSHLQSRWWFPSQKAFKGIAFELIFLGIL